MLPHDGQKPEIIAVTLVRKFLGDVDAVYVGSYEIRHIIAHPPVLHDGYDAGQKEYHGYGSEGECQLDAHGHPDREDSLEKILLHDTVL